MSQYVAVCCSALQPSYHSSLSHSHSLSRNTWENKPKQMRRARSKLGCKKTAFDSSFFEMRTKSRYLYKYTVFETVVDRPGRAYDRLMSEDINMQTPIQTKSQKCLGSEIYYFIKGGCLHGEHMDITSWATANSSDNHSPTNTANNRRAKRPPFCPPYIKGRLFARLI